jgi:hypothetical protein
MCSLSFALLAHLVSHCVRVASAAGAAAAIGSLPKWFTPQDRRLAAAALMLGADREAVQSRQQGDVYEFGVYTGGGMRAWVEFWRNASVTFHHLWGFDSFEGLPAVDMADEDPRLRARIESGGWQVRKNASAIYGGRRVPGQWKQSDGTYMGPGGYNAAMQLGLADFAQIEEHLQQVIGYGAHRTSLVKGFFNESLPALPAATLKRMKPAFVVDLDGDYYTSTIEPLEFLLAHCLLVAGTFVYYDDMQICRPGRGCGEGKAHDEVTARYAIEWQQLATHVFRVRRVQKPHSRCV